MEPPLTRNPPCVSGKTGAPAKNSIAVIKSFIIRDCNLFFFFFFLLPLFFSSFFLSLSRVRVHVLTEQWDRDTGREGNETDRPRHRVNTSEVNAIRAALISHHFIITIINIYLSWSSSSLSHSLSPSLFISLRGFSLMTKLLMSLWSPLLIIFLVVFLNRVRAFPVHAHLSCVFFFIYFN